MTSLDDGRAGAGWPIDERAMRDLLARIQRLACDPALNDEDERRRRLDALRAHASAASVTFDPEMAAVGRRITLADEDERIESFWLGLPGDERTIADTISVAAPAGRMLAGACVGDVVFLEADERRRWAVVMKVT